MKYLNLYKKIGLENNVDTIFNYFIKTLNPSIFTWDYFVDWEKIKKNVRGIEKELNLLNYLIGKDNIEFEFLKLVNEYPNLKKVLPILVAVRAKKTKDINIIINFENLAYKSVSSIFLNNTTETDNDQLLRFFKESGLEEIFKDKTIKNLVDYTFGVEAGLDTNARKNRTGNLMENILDRYLKTFTEKNQLELISQVTKTKIQNAWNFKLKVDKYDRVFDFSIYNKKKNRIYLIEANYYSGTGSKLKSTAGEYRNLHDFLKNQNINFIWITDGLGWEKTKNPLFETFSNNDYIFNLELVNKGALEEIII
jgi:type II restriction enzyme